MRRRTRVRDEHYHRLEDDKFGPALRKELHAAFARKFTRDYSTINLELTHTMGAANDEISEILQIKRLPREARERIKKLGAQLAVATRESVLQVDAILADEADDDDDF
jgi:hypothetical protein